MDKVVASCAEAVKDIPNGASIAVGGFGLNGIPHNAIGALLEQRRLGARDRLEQLRRRRLGSGRAARREAHPPHHRRRTSARTKSSSGNICRASSRWSSRRKGRSRNGCAPAAAASPAFYTPAGVGTQVADGGLPWRYDPDGSIALASPKKDVRAFGGRDYVLEEGIVTDFALVRASIGDRHGNLIFHKATRNFNPLCAMAGKITIAEVEELVEPGAIDPEQVHLPGIFVQRVVQVGAGGKRIERVTTRKRDGGR